MDKDKLAYLFQMMNADLIQSEVTDFERLDKHTRQVIKKKDGSVAVRRVISPIVNNMKMELCLRFHDTKPMKLSVAKVVSNTNSLQQEEIVTSKIQKVGHCENEIQSSIRVGSESATISNSVEQKANNPYGLNITMELVQLIEKRLRVKRQVAEFNDNDINKIITYKTYLQSLTMETSKEELYPWLRRVNAIYLSMALDELKHRNA